MKTILAFGDSLTWGFNPETGLRQAYEDRWPMRWRSKGKRPERSDAFPMAELWQFARAGQSGRCVVGGMHWQIKEAIDQFEDGRGPQLCLTQDEPIPGALVVVPVGLSSVIHLTGSRGLTWDLLLTSRR
jgi:hypothetical protein